MLVQHVYQRASIIVGWIAFSPCRNICWFNLVHLFVCRARACSAPWKHSATPSRRQTKVAGGSSISHCCVFALRLLALPICSMLVGLEAGRYCSWQSSSLWASQLLLWSIGG